jgi:hypothetical protein
MAEIVERSDGYPDTGVIDMHQDAGHEVISCSPSRLDFGVVTHTSTTLPIICTNVASQPWNFDPFTSTSGAFTAALRDGSPDRLSPGDSAVIDVSYRPSGTESDTGTLTIAVDPQDAIATVMLTGRAMLQRCDFTIAPSAFDAGTICSWATVEFEVMLTSPSWCSLSDLTLMLTSDCQGGASVSLESSAIFVDCSWAGTFDCNLTFSDPTNLAPPQESSLTGSCESSCSPADGG